MAVGLLGFEGSVTIQAGLPVVIAVLTYGKAFDIVGENAVRMKSIQNSFDIEW